MKSATRQTGSENVGSLAKAHLHYYYRMLASSAFIHKPHGREKGEGQLYRQSVRFKSTPMNGPRFTQLCLPWRSPIQVLTEINVPVNVKRISGYVEAVASVG